VAGAASDDIQAIPRENAVAPELAIHALVQMGGKEGNTKMNVGRAPLLFDPSMRVILRDTATTLLVVALKAILHSVIGVGLVHAISLAAIETKFESTPFSAAINATGRGSFTPLGKSTVLGNSTLETEGGLPLSTLQLHAASSSGTNSSTRIITELFQPCQCRRHLY
jgi:hypothetical protein